MEHSPPPSPTMVGRVGSTSPIPFRGEGQHHNRDGYLSKRDKRRHQLQEKLENLTTSFAANRDLHYREHLQAIQIDLNLIMDADPFTADLLPADPAAVEALVRDQMAKMKNMGPNIPPRAGEGYAEWAQRINDSIERRDATLVRHQREYEVRMHETNAAHAYRMKLAESEHKALRSTLRDRLINSITSKKNRLSRDRDTYDIAETSALLLHPSQFSHTNPTSPGGVHLKRTTRHRRDAEELPSFSEQNKRKRKAGEIEDSPVPSRQRAENGSSTPVWFKEKQATIDKQLHSPLFSIDKLFSERELSMTYNNAAMAAHEYMQRHAPYDDEDSPPNRSDPTSDIEDDKNDEEQDQVDSPAPFGGVGMERLNSHQTRSTRGNAPANYSSGIGIDALGDINNPASFSLFTRQLPKLPPYLPTGIMKVYSKGEAVNTPAPLQAEDMAAELELIRKWREQNETNGLGSNLDDEASRPRQMLEHATDPRRYQFWVASEEKSAYGKGFRSAPGDREDSGNGGLGLGANFMGSALGGLEMERTDSRVSNASDAFTPLMTGVNGGGTPMSRTGTGDGVSSSRGRKIIRREV